MGLRLLIFRFGLIKQDFIIRVQERLDDLGSEVKMLLQIHDELVLE
mgnify:CR=1 FL=1